MDAPRSLAGERTVLAWQRTVLAGGVVGVLGVLGAAGYRGPAVLAVAIAVCVWCATAAALLARRRPVGLSSPLPSPWSLLLLAASVPVGLAVTGVLLALP